ncbi:hypothetical protein TNCV_3112041 [Trichonephila clavipes]|nr:hypothetical protein TNCV_3112041 [Trichonephila clavipes]
MPAQTSKCKDFRSNCQENARLLLVHHPLPKSVPIEYLPFCVRGKFSQLARGNRGLMVVKGGEQQKFFQELGLYTMALENMQKFKDIYDGTFPNPVHEAICQRWKARRQLFWNSPEIVKEDWKLDAYLQLKFLQHARVKRILTSLKCIVWGHNNLANGEGNV